jgi:hypothetical protein
LGDPLFFTNIKNNAYKNRGDFRVIDTTEYAETILNKDRLSNWYLLSRLRGGKISDCDILGDSVHLLDAENGKHLYAVDSFQSFQALYEKVRRRPGPTVSLITRPDFHQELLDFDPFVRANQFHQLLCATDLPVRPMDGITFTPMQEWAIEWILSVYQHPELNADFIRNRIANSPTGLAIREGVPVGFIMSHCDAEIGPVYVDIKERGTGLATQLFARIVAEFLPKGLRPGVFVSLANIRSLAWLKKIGCIPLPHKALWFWQESSPSP